MRAALFAGIAASSFAASAAAQHAGHAMPGMTMPAKPALKRKPASKPAARKAQPRAAAKTARNASRPTVATKAIPDPRARPATGSSATVSHAGHDMQETSDAGRGNRAMRADPHAGHDAGTGLVQQGEQAGSTPVDPHAGHAMPGMAQGGQVAPPDPHAGHVMPAQPPAGSDGQDAHVGHNMGATADHSAPIGTNLPAGNAPAPTAFPGSAAGRFYGEREMDREVRDLKREHGGGVWKQALFNIAEVQVRDGRDGYRWDGEAWIGGDINRLVVRTEGAGDFRHELGEAQFEMLYSRALDPYLNLQAGVRYDVRPDPGRPYASVGFEALAPYWFDVETTVFLSDKGDVLAQAEAWYDQRLTNWWVLQPRAELNFAAQDIPEEGVGSGLSEIELSLRLRYEYRREFAPYVGVSWDKKVGDTARFARAEGESTGGLSFLAGLRVWF